MKPIETVGVGCLILAVIFLFAGVVLADETPQDSSNARHEIILQTLQTIKTQDQKLSALKEELKKEQSTRDILQRSLDQDVSILEQSGYKFNWETKELFRLPQ